TCSFALVHAAGVNSFSPALLRWLAVRLGQTGRFALPSGGGTAPERNRTGARLAPIYRGSRSTWKSFAASGVFQQAGFAKLLRLVSLCGTQPRSGRSVRRPRSRRD